VIKQRWFAAALLLVSCGGGGPAPTQPVNSAAGAVQGFMKAVEDSNLAKMASLWGTANGPASKTNQPPDWQRRVAIMQAYLQNDSFRLTADVPARDPNRRDLVVEIRRERRRTALSAVSRGTFQARPCYLLVSELQENPGGCLRVYERNTAARSSLSRHLVHQPISRFSAGFERGIEVGHPVTDVVNAGTPPSQELADGTIDLHRCKQLDLGIPKGECHDGCAIHHLRHMGLEAKNVAVKGKRRLEVGHRNTNMSNAGAVSH
jgi:hypothetical protein